MAAEQADLPLVQLLGSHVVDNKGEKRAVSDIASTATAVGLYFSAHWCGPCRAFTPVLAQHYPNLKAKKGFEVVFVSSDHDAKSFADYHGTMPWLAVPFADRDRKNALSKKFKVQGIPTFIILDPKTAKVINKDGRPAFARDPEGNDYPWAPKTVKQLVTNLVDGQGNTFTADRLAHKTVALYFSAKWCGPCKAFTPVLSQVYKKLQTEEKGFEVIFVSADRNEAEFKEYFNNHMPWLALPFSDKKAISELNMLFEIEGIPSLILLDWDTGKVINRKARMAIAKDPEGKNFPWIPSPVNVLTGHTAPDLNEAAGLIVFAGSEAKAATDVLTAVAKEHKAATTDEEEDPLNFFVEDGSDPELSGKLRQLMQLPSSGAAIGILNIPDASFVIAKSAEVTADNVRQFVQDFRAGKLQSKSLEGDDEQ